MGEDFFDDFVFVVDGADQVQILFQNQVSAQQLLAYPVQQPCPKCFAH
jgi:hypothetical protein